MPWANSSPARPLSRAKEASRALRRDPAGGGQGEARHLPGAENQPREARIRRQDIAPGPQNQCPAAPRQQKAVHFRQLRSAPGKGHGRRSADPKGRAVFQRFGLHQLHAGKCLGKGLKKFLLHHQRLRVFNTSYHLTTTRRKKKLLSDGNSRRGQMARADCMSKKLQKRPIYTAAGTPPGSCPRSF